MLVNASIANTCYDVISDNENEIRGSPMYKIFSLKYEPILEEFAKKIKVRV